MLLNTLVPLGYDRAVINAIIRSVLNIKTLSLSVPFLSCIPFTQCVLNQICTGIFGLYIKGCAIGGACEQRTEFTLSPHK